MNSEKKFLSRRELGFVLGISLSTVDRGIKSGRWPFNNRIKIGGSVRFPLSILDDIKASAISGMPVKEELAHG